MANMSPGEPAVHSATLFRKPRPLHSWDVRVQGLLKAYQQEKGLVGTLGVETLRTLRDIRRVAVDDGVRRSGYSHEGVGEAFRTAAALLKADLGLAALHVDVSGWDTHVNQGPVDGHMARSMHALGSNLGAFHADITRAGLPVTVVVLSEFGRTVQENGGQGTDHGRATTCMLLGKAVAGGRVYAPGWQSLSPDDLDGGRDLHVMIDFRDVLGELIRKRLDASLERVAFPGHVHSDHHLFR